MSTTHTTTTRAARRGRARLASIPGSGPRAAARLAGAHRPGRIWILTDRRYLDQRMPRALTDWLARQGHAPRVVVADDGPVFSHISPLADPVVTSGDGWLRFEGFSSCCSTYVRADLSPQAYDGRVLTHSLFGCFFYGAFVFKMLILTRDDTPKWALPLAGGLVLTGVTALWVTGVLSFLIA